MVTAILPITGLQTPCAVDVNISVMVPVAVSALEGV